jgi:hypothetical protein
LSTPLSPVWPARQYQPLGQTRGRLLPWGQAVPLGHWICVALTLPVGQKCPSWQGPEHSGVRSMVELP